MNTNEFASIMTRLKTVYPNFKINEKETQAIWWEKLSPLKYDYCRIAVDNYTDTERFAPTPADIITRYREVEERNHGRYMDLMNDFEIMHEYFPLEFREEDDKQIFLSAIKSQTYDECKRKAVDLKRLCYELCMNNKPTKNFKGVVEEWTQKKI